VLLKRDAAFLATGAAQAPIQNANATGQPATNPAAGLTNPPGNVAPTPAARDYFVLLMNGSKEPLIIDQNTVITIGNRKGSLQELVEGSGLNVSMQIQADGTRLITAIQANVPNNSGVAQVDQRDPRPPQNPVANTNQSNSFSGQVVRRKNDSLFVQASQGELVVMMTANSVEPLRADDRTRFVVNGQEARFTDLQNKMSARVFLEVFNQVRRVIGVEASNNANQQQTRPGGPVNR
jgi:hypothetical protein